MCVPMLFSTPAQRGDPGVLVDARTVIRGMESKPETPVL